MADPEQLPIQVFVSYARSDAAWLQRLQVLLSPVARNHNLRLLVDTDIPVGAAWSDAIDANMRAADIAVLFISPRYLASEFSVNTELTALLGRRQNRRIALLPVLVEESFWTQVPGLTDLQFVVDPARPLASLPPNEQDSALSDVVRRIVELAGQIRRQRESPNHPEPVFEHERDGPLQAFISHSHADGDFAELLKLRLEEYGVEAWIDLDRLDPGVDWQQGIDTAIKASSAVIAVLSPDARRSEYVTYEWSYALGLGVRVIPLMLRQTPLHPRLATFQYLDFTLRGGRPWNRLIAALEVPT